MEFCKIRIVLPWMLCRVRNVIEKKNVFPYLLYESVRKSLSIHHHHHHSNISDHQLHSDRPPSIVYYIVNTTNHHSRGGINCFNIFEIEGGPTTEKERKREIKTERERERDIVAIFVSYVLSFLVILFSIAPSLPSSPFDIIIVLFLHKEKTQH
jgi:hypothetical protein